MFSRASTMSSSFHSNTFANGKAFHGVARRVKLLGSGAVLALCAAAAPQLAMAANECGAGTSVTCTSTGNNYTSGIAYTSAADQTVNLSSGVVVDATSPNTGLSVTSTGPTGVVTVNGGTGVSITSEGAGDPAVNLTSLGGNITANLATVVTKGDTATGVVASSGAGTLSLTIGSVTTSGTDAEGISGESTSGDVNINATTVSTAGAGATGITTSDGTGRISITAATVTTTGANATGIFAANGSGAIAINAGTISTSGAGSDGIDAVGFSPDAVVAISTTGPVTTTGDNAAGILVATPGDVTITTAGNISTSGVLAPGVNVASSSGTVALNATSGAINSLKGDGVDLSGDTVTATIGSKASISGATVGLAVDSTTASTINNAGTIGSSGGYAVFAEGGPVTLGNSGTINRGVNFASDGNVINNSGTFNASIDSVFGVGGTDVFNNTGTVNVVPTATTATSVTFTNLGTFNNKGVVSLQNGHAGDNLTLPGAFVGAGGSTLAVDVTGGTTANADTLTVLGAATGTTAIQVNAIGGGLATDHIVVASGGVGSSATAFSLTSSSGNVGFIHYDLIYDPTAGTYSLVGSPGAAVAETVKVQEAISDFWKISADAWQAHMASARDAAWAGGGSQGVHGWGQLYGGARDRSDVMQTTAFNVGHTYDLSYDSNTYGFQGGLDLVTGPWVAGLTAGYAGQDMRFEASNDKTLMQGYNVGAYAGIMSHGAYITVLAKYNDDRIQMGSQFTGPIDFSAHTYGGQIDMGYRFGLGGSFFVEPIGSFSYTRTYFDDINAYNSTFDFSRYTGEEGKAGLRFGAAMGDWMGAKVIPFGSVVAVHEFRDNGGFVFSNGGYDFDYFNHPRGSYGHASAGLSFLNQRGVDGFIQGDYDFATGTGGGGARVGVRFAF